MRVAVFGNPTLDEVYRDGKIVVVPGGSGFYVSSACAFLGARVELVGNIGGDYSSRFLKWLEHRGVGVGSVQRGVAPTTRFRLSYRGSSRTLRLLHPSRPLVSSFSGGRWDAVHVGPVFGEVGRDLVLRLRRSSRLVSLDLQGFLRDSSTDGVVHLHRRDLAGVLSSCDVVKASLEEAVVQTRTKNYVRAAAELLDCGPRHAIITRAGKGAVLASRKTGLFHVPGHPENVVVDPTGAGDGFVGSWLTTFVSTGDPVWAASVGSAFASLMLRRRGLGKFRFSRRELARRAAWVYGNVRPLG